MSLQPRSPLWAVLGASLWMALACNAALWRELDRLGVFGSAKGWAFGLALLMMVTAALGGLLSLLAWRWTLKPAISVAVVLSALASHFMLSYHVVIDPRMVENVLQTDLHEAGALLNLRLAGMLLLLALPPLWLVWAQPLKHGGMRRQVLRNGTTLAAAALLLVVLVLASFQPLASITRSHKALRYLINPLNTLYGLAYVGTQPWRRDDSTLVVVGQDARLGDSHPGRTRPPLLLLVLGETARSGNFGINGYERQTTPELALEQVASFRNAWSCGTNTAVSVPCMFSNLTQQHFGDRKTQFEGLLDVLQRAGFAVLWLDNQSGCKGVCDRIPTVSTTRSADAELCAGGDCLDSVMLKGLDQRVAALPAERRARGVVLVMHQMGSHGPAYHLRSPATHKRFMPECTSSALQDCSSEGLTNAYDNSIAYTDHFLARSIAWLKAQQDWADPALVYVADHGESLGENNLYLHGLPYAIAPDVQKRIPWITWLSTQYSRVTRLSVQCLKAQSDHRLSHDSYFHSVLGLMDVATSAYRYDLDAYAACRADIR